MTPDFNYRTETRTKIQVAVTLSICGLAAGLSPAFAWLVTEKPVPTLVSGVIAAIVVILVSRALDAGGPRFPHP